jgi:hypothetical protein
MRASQAANPSDHCQSRLLLGRGWLTSRRRGRGTRRLAWKTPRVSAPGGSELTRATRTSCRSVSARRFRRASDRRGWAEASGSSRANCPRRPSQRSLQPATDRGGRPPPLPTSRLANHHHPPARAPSPSQDPPPWAPWSRPSRTTPPAEAIRTPRPQPGKDSTAPQSGTRDPEGRDPQGRDPEGPEPSASGNSAGEEEVESLAKSLAITAVFGARPAQVSPA